jgi:hypothetical protein
VSPANCTTGRRRPRQVDFGSVVAAARLQLCVVAEPPEVRARHVAALLAWTPRVRRIGNRMMIRFDHGPTALWLTETLARPDTELLEVGGDGGLVAITNPQTVLGRYGYRDGRWMFGQGAFAALGISRGAVHAAGSLGRTGLRVACPTAPLMLTLTAVMSRLDIAAKPTEGEPCAVISAGDVPDALARLGIAEVAGQYRRLRETNVNGNGKGAKR